ncbi:MAG: hypothetical protein U0414_31675 [Polyangiaceae bacterium]
MPARVTVYCRRSVAHLRRADLEAEIEAADLMTLAEALDLPEGEEAAVEAMRPHLRWGGDEGSVDAVELHWKPEGRPIQIERVDDAGAVRADVDEVLEALDEDEEAAGVCEHLRGVREIVYFEMGIDDSMHLGATLTEVLAFFVADAGDGLVDFYRRDWASPNDRAENLYVWPTPG